MKKKINLGLLFGILLLYPLCLLAETPPEKPVALLTVGKLNTGAKLYINGSLRTVEAAHIQIPESGITSLTGSFIHDAPGHAFETELDGWSKENNGTLRFVGTDAPATRYITATAVNSFNRAVNYVAFPNLVIATDDTVKVRGKMGLDAWSIIREGAGQLLLQSEVVDGDVFDASLRIGADAGAGAGAIAIERDLSLYRDGNAEQVAGNLPLFAFASPMQDLRAGYFAGNWIRKLIPGENGHVAYVYGDEYAADDPTKTIIPGQYLSQAGATFQPGNGYLVKARPKGFDYSGVGNLIGGDSESSLYDKGVFRFDGQTYDTKEGEPYSEQVFAADNLFSRTLESPTESTINWVIGNSWTSAISVAKLGEKMGNSGLIFEPSVYVYPNGASSYLRYSDPEWIGETLENAGVTGTIPELTSIPSQSLFIIRVLKDSQDGDVDDEEAEAGGAARELTLNKRDLQIHSNVAHNAIVEENPEEAGEELFRSSTSRFKDEVLFKVTPATNPNIYDLAVIGLRPNASEAQDSQDDSKVYQSNSSVFQLYSLSSDNQKLAVNVVPNGTKTVKLCLAPSSTGGELTLTATRTESLAQIWLEDRLTHEVIDLKDQDSYTFTADKEDTPERFLVHFLTVPTGTDKIQDSFLQAYSRDNELVIKGLTGEDIYSTVSIYDVQGRLLQTSTVTQSPETHIPLALSNGIYIAKLQGNRNITVKFIKKGDNQ